MQTRTPQQNGVVEWKNHTLLEKARTMILSTNMPIFLWTKVVNITNLLVNKSPTKANP
jgi:hypothetical protein